MLQVALSGGEVRVVEVPEPVVRLGTVRVRTSHSLISAGTESAGIGSGGRPESLVIRAIKNPALVKKVVERVRHTAPGRQSRARRARVAEELGDWDATKILEKTGIAVRSIARPDEYSSDLGVAAAQRLFASGVCAAEERVRGRTQRA